MQRVLGVDNVLIPVGSLESALAFYGEQLGLPVAFAVPEAGIALFRLGDEEPGLLIRGQESPPGTSAMRLWLEVADARAAAADLASRDIEPMAEPFEIATGWTVEFTDPWGNVIGFTDYTKDPAKGRQRSS